MRVLIVGDYPPPYGGSSVQVSVLHRLLSATPGCTCRVLDVGTTRRRRRSECLPARNALEFGGRLLAYAARGYRLHLHTNGHTLKSWLVTLACASAGLLNGRQTVVSLGSGLAPDFIEQSTGPRRGLIRGALGLLGAIICRNERTRAVLIALGVPAHRIVILPGFYGTRTFDRTTVPAPIADFLVNHSPVLAAIASSGPEYGIPLFLEAAHRLRPRYPRLGVLLIGPARLERQDLDGDLLCAGELPHDLVLTIMPRVTVFVRPTYFDGDASSVREALALGVRVVASDTDFRPGGVALFRRGDVADLTDTLAHALRNGSNPHDQPRPAEPNAFERLLAIYRRLGQAAPLQRELP